MAEEPAEMWAAAARLVLHVFHFRPVAPARLTTLLARSSCAGATSWPCKAEALKLCMLVHTFH